MDPIDRPCTFYGSGISHDLNNFVADIFGISQLNEDDVPRSLGCPLRPSRPAVFWHIGISHPINTYVSKPRSHQPNYDCTEVYSYRPHNSNQHGRCHVAYIIHPLPVSELHQCELFPAHEIDLSINGVDTTVDARRFTRFIRCDGDIVIEWNGWRPFAFGD